jgi:cytochrome c556
MKKRPAEFREILRRSEAAAKVLEQLLRRSKPDRRQLDAQFTRITADCTACHQKYRDTPLQEKAAAK